MRLSAKSLDVDAFRSFIEAAGGAFEPAKEVSGEILRFRVGHAFGLVSRRKDGSLTLAGEAKPQFRTFSHGKPEPEAPPPKRLQVITTTMPATDHERAREMLSGAKKASVYTDGSASSGGVGFGGWAAIIRAGAVNVEIYGGAPVSTVNRMEIMAALAALRLLPPGCVIKINTDSKYLRDGISKWIDTWKRRGWITAAGEPVKNEDLWRKLDEARSLHTVSWKYIPAHRGIRHNERADELAKAGRREAMRASA